MLRYNHIQGSGSDSVQSMLAAAFRDQSACWIHVPTVSKVLQQDLGYDLLKCLPCSKMNFI